MTTYTPPAWTTFTDLFSYANTVTDYMIGNVFILSFFLVAFIAMKDYGSERAFLGSSIFCFMIALVGWALNMVAGLAVVVTLSMITIGLVINWRAG